MFDLSTRLIIAYGLIALMVMAAAAVVMWLRYHSPRRRYLRDQARTDAFYLRRQHAAAADDRGPA